MDIQVEVLRNIRKEGALWQTVATRETFMLLRIFGSLFEVQWVLGWDVVDVLIFVNKDYSIKAALRKVIVGHRCFEPLVFLIYVKAVVGEIVPEGRVRDVYSFLSIGCSEI